MAASALAVQLPRLPWSYTGGIFEWMLLHEIYGKDLFKITKYEIDILRYRPKSVLLTAMSGGSGATGEDDGEFGGYIEDGTGANNTQQDFRIHIPENTSNVDDESGGGNLLSNGMQNHKNVKFAGYNIPHLLENKVIIHYELINEKIKLKDVFNDVIINLLEIFKTLMKLNNKDTDNKYYN
jgi:DNA-directed RNA polymerase subunit L